MCCLNFARKISALLHKICKEKQENKGNVQLNGFITETRHLFAACLC